MHTHTARLAKQAANSPGTYVTVQPLLVLPKSSSCGLYCCFLVLSLVDVLCNPRAMALLPRCAASPSPAPSSLPASSAVWHGQCVVPADAPEESQQVSVLNHVATLIPHCTHELEQPDGRVCSQRQGGQHTAHSMHKAWWTRWQRSEMLGMCEPAQHDTARCANPTPADRGLASHPNMGRKHVAQLTHSVQLNMPKSIATHALLLVAVVVVVSCMEG